MDAAKSVVTDMGVETLAKGKVLRQINDRLQAAWQHCQDLPGLSKAREVTVVFSLSPDGDGVQVGTKIRRSFPEVKGPVDRIYLRDGRPQVLNVESTEDRQTDIVAFTAAKQHRETLSDGK